MLYQPAFNGEPGYIEYRSRDTSRFYGDENPATPWSAKDFVFSGFVNGDTEAIFTNSQVNVLPDVTYGGADKNSVPGTFVIGMSGGQAANYTLNLQVWSNAWPDGRGLLTVKQAPLTLAVPDSARLYDDANVKNISGKELLITDGTLKNDQTLEALFGNIKLPVTHTAVSGALGSNQK